jgi:hypothetical protein
MQQKTVKKLSLSKKTITRLNEGQLKQVEGGSLYTTTSIIIATAGCVTNRCGSDFTRPGTTVISIGTSGG